jgi:hypothetical protein
MGRKKLLAVLAVAVAVAGSGLAIARADTAGPDPETYFEKTGVGPSFEHGMKDVGAASSTVGDPGVGAYQVGAQVASGGPAFSFFPDQEMPCSLEKDGALIGCGQTVEPEVKSGPDGSIFATAQDGTPGGILAWRRDPGTFAYQQLDKPDGAPVVGNATGLTGGGGDNELAISAPDAQGNYRVYVSSLMSLATNGVGFSTDKGKTWIYNPIASNFAGVDRQWLAASGEKTVYLAYHDLYTHSIFMNTSTDGGLTWGPAMPMMNTAKLDFEGTSIGANIGIASVGSGSSNWESNLVALPGGGVAMSYIRAAHYPKCVNLNTGCPAEPRNQLWAIVTDSKGKRPVNTYIGTLPGGDQGILFPSIAVDRAGNLYVVETNGSKLFLSHSTNRGAGWSPLVDVTASAPVGTTDASLFPYLVAGSPGKVALSWLGAGGANDANAKWTTQFAETSDALADNPTFAFAQASNHIVHTGQVCVGGLSCNATDPTGTGGRELAEVLQMGITKDGRILIAYPDNSDGRHASGWTWIVEQNQGPGLYDDVIPTPPPAPVLGHPTAGFTSSGTQSLYFTNTADGLPASPAPGYQFDGTSIAGALSSFPGAKGHVGVVGFVANSIPGVSKSLVFETGPLGQETTVGGSLGFKLWMQNELGSNGASELDFSLLDVATDGSSTAIIGRGVQNGDPVVATSAPSPLSFSYSIDGGYVIPAGHTLRIEMSFPFLVSSTTRFYYGDALYDSGITLGVGTGS